MWVVIFAGMLRFFFRCGALVLPGKITNIRVTRVVCRRAAGAEVSPTWTALNFVCNRPLRAVCRCYLGVQPNSQTILAIWDSGYLGLNLILQQHHEMFLRMAFRTLGTPSEQLPILIHGLVAFYFEPYRGEPVMVGNKPQGSAAHRMTPPTQEINSVIFINIISITIGRHF